MKVPATILFLLFFSGFILAQEDQEERNYIYWSDDYKLVWTDFEEIPERYSQHSAFSVVGYESSFNMNNQQYEAVIKTYFSKNESWSKSWVASLLLHEQGHFDLAEVNARKFRKCVLEAMRNETISVSKFEQMNEEAMNQLKEAQKEYDEATNFSMDYPAQLKWSEQISEQLKELEAFASPQVVVTRKAN